VQDWDLALLTQAYVEVGDGTSGDLYQNVEKRKAHDASREDAREDQYSSDAVGIEGYGNEPEEGDNKVGTAGGRN
jgi:hypothetical protein